MRAWPEPCVAPLSSTFGVQHCPAEAFSATAELSGSRSFEKKLKSNLKNHEKRIWTAPLTIKLNRQQKVENQKIIAYKNVSSTQDR
jgi:hypothetical protein